MGLVIRLGSRTSGLIYLFNPEKLVFLRPDLAVLYNSPMPTGAITPTVTGSVSAWNPLDSVYKSINMAAENIDYPILRQSEQVLFQQRSATVYYL